MICIYREVSLSLEILTVFPSLMQATAIVPLSDGATALNKSYLIWGRMAYCHCAVPHFPSPCFSSSLNPLLLSPNFLSRPPFFRPFSLASTTSSSLSHHLQLSLPPPPFFFWPFLCLSHSLPSPQFAHLVVINPIEVHAYNICDVRMTCLMMHCASMLAC